MFNLTQIEHANGNVQLDFIAADILEFQFAQFLISVQRQFIVAQMKIAKCRPLLDECFLFHDTRIEL